MSRRVTTKTEMKDKALALQACKKEGIGVVEQGDSLRFTSGRLNGAVLDLGSGQITGDSDYYGGGNALGTLRQSYSEAKCRNEYMKQGISIEKLHEPRPFVASRTFSISAAR